MRFDLKPFNDFIQYLDLLPLKARAIHVAGTNGKGSVTVMIDQILQEYGFSVGRYTSPHLHDFRERIAVDGKIISVAALEELSDLILTKSEQSGIKLTFFEATTLIALLYFKKLNVDWVVLEVGLGGRLDATNVVDSELVALPSIGLDHTELLGHTEREIAIEKCGVLRKRSKLISGPVSKEAEEAISSEVQAKDVDWFKYGESFSLDENWVFRFGEQESPLVTPLQGEFQRINTAVAVASIGQILDGLDFQIINSALKKIKWPGRFERIKDWPPVWLDVAHNPAGITALIESLPRDLKVHFFYAASRGKDIQKMCNLLLSRGVVHYFDVEHERLMSLLEFTTMFPELTKNFSSSKKLDEIRIELLNEPTVICGSVYLIGEVRKFLQLERAC